MTEQQQQRLNELAVYARRVRSDAMYGFLGCTKEQKEMQAVATNVLTYLLLIEGNN